MTQAKSFGVVALFQDQDGYQVLLVKNAKGGHWGLPKGTPEGSEAPRETALRELEEETGVHDIRLTDQTFQEHYTFEQNGITYDKTNTYYLGFVSEATLGQTLDDVSEVKWVPLSKAGEHVTHQSARDVIDQVAGHLMANP